MTRAQFAQIVADALAALPPEFARHLQNITIDIEDEPSTRTLIDLGLDPDEDTIFGLYDGVPLPERGDSLLPLPDRIVLYFRPLVETFSSQRELQREIEQTVLHEIGHALGLEDDDEEMDY